MAHFPQSSTLSRALLVALSAGSLSLAGCDKTPQAVAPQTPATPVQPVAVAAPAYTPPTAEQLYQMVAPIAVYPDKLVAQVLAGATYPTQITAADQWLAQNGGLQGGALADAADRQPWDPSVKSLTAFRSVLDQMAKNLPWSTALGEAYYNDPVDVMNAIQVMRQRAANAGELKSTPKLRVATRPRPLDPAPVSSAQTAYVRPVVVEPPPQFITIEPDTPDVVYVPTYNPERIYGTPLPVYPGYAYAPPPPVYAEPRYSNAQIATAGALTFGLGVVVGSALERHDWGWHSWGMNWGDRRPPPGRAPRDEDRPNVVYNRSTYVSHSETVVNNNVHNNIRNVYNNGPSPQQQAQQNEALQIQARQQQAQLDAQRVQQAQQQAQLQQSQRAQQVQHDTSHRQQEQQLQVQAQQQQAQLRQQQEQQRQQLAQQSHSQELARQQQDQAHRQQERQAQRVQQQAQQQQTQQAQRAQQEQARRQQEQQSQQNAQAEQRRQQEQQHEQQRAQQEQARHQQLEQRTHQQQQAEPARHPQEQAHPAHDPKHDQQQVAHRPGRPGEDQRP